MTYWASPEDSQRAFSRLDALPRVDPQDPGFFDGLAPAAARIVPALGTRFGLAAEEAITPEALPIAESFDQRFGTKSADWLNEQQRITRREAIRNVPDPHTTGTAGQILFGLGTVLPEMVGATVAGRSPVAGAAYETFVEGSFRRAQLEASGVDPETAKVLGYGQGAVTGMTAFLPAALGIRQGASILANAGRSIAAQAGANVTIGAGERYATAAYLEAKGYHDQAAQIHPFAGAEVATDAALGGIFGLWALKHAPAPERTPIPGTSDTAAAATAPIYAPEGPRADAAMALNLAGHAQLDVAPGLPHDIEAVNAHVDAVTKATEDLLADRPVAVDEQLEGAQFDPLPPEVQAAQRQRELDAVGAIKDVFDDQVAAGDERIAAQPRAALDYTPNENLSPEHRAIETDFAAQLADEQATRDRYAAIPETQGGKMLNTDVMRELNDKYLSDRTLSAAVHEPSSAAVKREFAARLTQAPGPGEQPIVMFTAGGTGAGKTRSIEDLPELNARKQAAQIVYDTNMNRLDNSVTKIEQALAAGKEVSILAVYRDPVESLIHGALKRAKDQEAIHGSGRTLPLQEHANTHQGLIPTMLALAERYRDDPRVSIDVLDNSRGKGQQRLIEPDQALEFLRAKAQDIPVSRLRAAFDRAYAKEPFSEAIYRGFVGEPPAGSAVARSGAARAQEQNAQRLPGGDAAQRPSGGAQDQVGPGLPRAILGAAGEVKIGDKFEATRWALVDAAELAPAVGKGENQARDRTRAASEQQVAKIAAAIDFRLLGESPVMDLGAPTLAADGRVVGGNGRVLAIARAYQSGNGDAYRAPLLEALPKFGLDPKAAEGMKQPALVRILGPDVNVRQAALASNEGAGMRMSLLEQAPVDAERLPNLDSFYVPEDGNLNAPGNVDFIRSWINRLPATEQAALVDAKGALSQEGMIRLRNAVLFKAYGESLTLARLVELTDQGAKNVSNALAKAAPIVATDRAAIARGDLHDADLVPDLLAAVEKYAQIKAEGTTTRDYLAQGGLFGQELSGEGAQLLAYIDGHARSAKAISDLVFSYYKNLEAAGNPKQADMLGGGIPAKAQLLERAITEAEGASASTLSLFDDRPAAELYPGLAAAPQSVATSSYRGNALEEQAAKDAPLIDTAANCEAAA